MKSVWNDIIIHSAHIYGLSRSPIREAFQQNPVIPECCKYIHIWMYATRHTRPHNNEVCMFRYTALHFVDPVLYVENGHEHWDNCYHSHWRNNIQLSYLWHYIILLLYKVVFYYSLFVSLYYQFWTFFMASPCA
jgi:hypothetical protein